MELMEGVRASSRAIVTAGKRWLEGSQPETWRCRRSNGGWYRVMVRALSGGVAATLLVIVACSSKKPAELGPMACFGKGRLGCACQFTTEDAAASAPTFTCDTSIEPGAICCALRDWPNEANSECQCAHWVTCRLEGSSCACVDDSVVETNGAGTTVAICYPGGIGLPLNNPGGCCLSASQSECICDSSTECPTGFTQVSECRADLIKVVCGNGFYGARSRPPNPNIHQVDSCGTAPTK